ncbi:porin [Paraburkholderia sacchari]|uniref:Porin n=1 Tax=Paraburkholderia sacchari TaxID=159450 RepID=A0A8T6ZFF6_9BURK|nr:porin [Paraburkholderia sacchari]NLP63478.1 porin [Paraburkholderia sacchari]
MTRTLKLSAFALATLGAICQQPCSASSMTLYGTLDDGIAYINNVGGKSVVKAQNAGSWSNNFGFRGEEDLGGSTRVLFNLNSTFNLNNGVLSNNGALFGNSAWLGITNDQYGTLALGRQFDFTVDLLLYSSAASSTLFSFHPGSVDRINGVTLSNSVRYESPKFAGFSGKALYSFGDPNGGTNSRRSNSFELTYSNGVLDGIVVYSSIGGTSITPSTSMGVSEFFGTPLSLSTATPLALRTTDIYAAAARYHIGSVTLRALYTDVVFTSAKNGRTEKLRTPEIGASWQITTFSLVTAGFWQSRLDDSRWNTLNVSYDYFLSKRTDVTVGGNFQRTSGPGQVASLFTAGNSSTTSQVALYAGIRHRF